MWRWMARPLDQLAIRSACGAVRPGPDGRTHAEEAAALLRSAQFFSPEVTLPPVIWTSPVDLHLASPVPGVWAGNNTIRARLVPAAREWRERSTVLLLHGWNGELQHRWLSPRWARQLARAGVNAVLFELPLHGRRRPPPGAPIRNFLSGDLRHVLHATHQTLAEIRMLARWLRAEGVPQVGLWGVSLGAWLAGLAAAHQPEVDFAALITPVVRLDRALHELPFVAGIRAELAGLENQFRPLNLIEHAPRLTANRVLLVAGTLDLFAAPDTIAELAAQWEAEVWWRPHGHISLLLAPGELERVARWAQSKTAEPQGSAAV